MSIKRTILITGAAKRVGAATARCLHAADCNIAIHYHRSGDDAARLVSELNQLRADSAHAFQADLRDLPQLSGLIERVMARFTRLDGVVNNASAFYPTPVGELTLAQWDDLAASNLVAPLFLSQAAVPHLRAQRGAIVNIVDIHAQRPLKGYLAYSVAKAGLAGLTRALALELGPDIRCNGVAPGPVMWPTEGDHFPPNEKARILATTPLARDGSAADIAGAVRYLLLDAPYVTGQILAVDGGREVFL
jgi:pteridine reductase